MAHEHLATYLNDHLAGSTIAIEHLEHLAAANRDLAPALAELRADVEADRAELQELICRLKIGESGTRKAGAWIAEKAARVKMRLDDKTGPLRRLESLEAVALGIDGKAALWRALSAAAEGTPSLGGLDYDRLIERAREQRQRVEVLRLQAARSALAATP